MTENTILSPEGQDPTEEAVTTLVTTEAPKTNKTNKTKLAISIGAVAALAIASIVGVNIANQVAFDNAKSEYAAMLKKADDTEKASKDPFNELTIAKSIGTKLDENKGSLIAGGSHDATSYFDPNVLKQVETDLSTLDKIIREDITIPKSIARPAMPSTTDGYTSATQMLSDEIKRAATETDTLSKYVKTLSDANGAARADFATLAKSVPAQSAALLTANPKADKTSVDDFNEAVAAVAAVKPQGVHEGPETAYVEPIQRYIDAAKALQASQVKAAAVEKAAADATSVQTASEATTQTVAAEAAAQTDPVTAGPRQIYSGNGSGYTSGGGSSTGGSYVPTPAAANAPAASGGGSTSGSSATGGVPSGRVGPTNGGNPGACATVMNCAR